MIACLQARTCIRFINVSPEASVAKVIFKRAVRECYTDSIGYPGVRVARCAVVLLCDTCADCGWLQLLDGWKRTIAVDIICFAGKVL